MAQCDAAPVCDSGDEALMGPCPPNLSCYTRTLCGTTLYCLHRETGSGGAAGSGGAGGGGGGSACSPMEEYYRHYVSTTPETCLLIDYSCPAGTRYFGNDCGCGCEQPTSCPEWVNCQPGQDRVSALCNSEECPYTVRAQ